MIDDSFSITARNLLDQLEDKHGGRRMPAIGNKIRWKAPWPMSKGNTVACLKHKDGSHSISATGRAAEVTREILGMEDEIKLTGVNLTQYSIWKIWED